MGKGVRRTWDLKAYNRNRTQIRHVCRWRKFFFSSFFDMNSVEAALYRNSMLSRVDSALQVGLSLLENDWNVVEASRIYPGAPVTNDEFLLWAHIKMDVFDFLMAGVFIQSFWRPMLSGFIAPNVMVQMNCVSDLETQGPEIAARGRLERNRLLEKVGKSWAAFHYSLDGTILTGAEKDRFDLALSGIPIQHLATLEASIAIFA
ncbi:hypothetical protein DFJ74DRAFT_765906 [Hyaloraphidium curvatum]|nr:hypothetical protein DFJ74DRAFT_765906 [Hyaloraphidium curvatum]